MSDPEFMNVGEAADYLRLHRSTVSRMVAAGRIPHVLFGRAPRFSRTVLLRWYEEQAGVAAATPTAAPTSQHVRLKPKHVGRRRASVDQKTNGKPSLGVVPGGRG